MQFSYTSRYSPPAPIAELVMSNPVNGAQSSTFVAILDSGADATIIPIAYIHEIQAVETQQKALRTQWGNSYPVMLYLVDIEIGDIVLYGVEVVGDSRGDEAVVGRDILNRLHVTLNGPNKSVTLAH